MAPFVGETLREISLKLPTTEAAQTQKQRKQMQRGERDGELCVPLFVWPLNAAIISLKSHSVRQLRGKQWKRIRIPKWTDCHRQPQPQQQQQHQQEEEALEETERERKKLKSSQRRRLRISEVRSTSKSIRAADKVTDWVAKYTENRLLMCPVSRNYRL